MIANLVLASIARIAGSLTDRPVSGKWLARYFLGRSGTHSLPRELEAEVLALARDETVMEFCECTDGHEHLALDPDPDCPVCSGTGDILPLEPFTVCPHAGTDLYTCVGTFSVQWQENGSLRYWDTYDWHDDEGWSFDVKLGFLPFSVEIKGKDTWFTKAGKEFLTAGTIATSDILPADNFNLVDESTFSLTKLVRNAKRRWWNLWHTGESYLTKEKYLSPDDLAKLKGLTFDD